MIVYDAQFTFISLIPYYRDLSLKASKHLLVPAESSLTSVRFSVSDPARRGRSEGVWDLTPNIVERRGTLISNLQHNIKPVFIIFELAHLNAVILNIQSQQNDQTSSKLYRRRDNKQRSFWYSSW